MNYSRSIKRDSIAKRILFSWAVIGIIFLLAGILIGWLVFNRDSPKEEVLQEQQEQQEEIQEVLPQEILIYGRYDGKIFEGEMSKEWEGGLKFVPLDVEMGEELQKFVFYLCDGYDIDFTLVMALIQHESGFRADVISKSDDYGLMQINTINHDYLRETIGVIDFLDPYSNIRSGMFILRKLFEKYDTTEKVLMAYNMGETGASRLWEQGIYETNYTKKVLQYQQQFIEELEGTGEQND